MHKNDLTIIGGGIIGLCSAYYAATEGFTVTILEQEEESFASASFGNAGMIVPSHFIPLAAPGMISKGLKWMLNPESPFYVKPRPNLDLMRWGALFYTHATKKHTNACKELLAEMHLSSRQLFIELQAELEFTLEKKGLLMLSKTQKNLDEEAQLVEIANTVGIKAEVCDSARLKQLDPKLTMDVKGGVWFEQDCHLSPHQFIKKMRCKLADMGVTTHYNSKVEKLHTVRNKVNKLTLSCGKSLSCENLVIAGGAWTSSIVKQLGIPLPMQAGKGYSLTLETPAQLPQICSILSESKVAVTPMGSSLRFAGTMEIGGVNHEVNQRRVRGIIKSIPQYLPEFSELDFKGITPWAGLRPCSPDGLPYLGKVPNIDNVIIASGHGMMGVSLAPITGKTVCNILTEKLSEISQLSPSRF